MSFEKNARARVSIRMRSRGQCKGARKRSLGGKQMEKSPESGATRAGRFASLDRPPPRRSVPLETEGNSRFALRFRAHAPSVSPPRCTHWRQCDVLRRRRRSEAPPEAQRPRREKALAHRQRQRRAAAGVLPRPPVLARASCLLLRARRRRSLPQTMERGTRSRAPRARRRSAWELRGGAARQRRGRMNRTTTTKKTLSPKMPSGTASGAARAPSERPRRPWY